MLSFGIVFSVSIECGYGFFFLFFFSLVILHLVLVSCIWYLREKV